MMRRPRRLLAVLLVPVVLAAACGDDGGDEVADGAAGWSFTDDRGEEISLPERPQRIVAYDNAAAGLLPLGIRPVAVFGGAAPDDSPLLDGLDIDGIESVGAVYGEINLEKLASLEPDLIVTLFDPDQEGPAFGFVEDGQDLAEDIAPVLALNGAADALPGIERFEELATALGADVDAAAVADDRAAFEAAVDDLGAAVQEHPGVTALAFQVYAGDGVYYARPDAFPSLRLFREAGLDLVEPEGDRGDVNEDFVSWFWEYVSLELGGTYPADLLLVGNNEGAMDVEQLRSVATMAARPALEAGQTVTWQVLDRYSYDSFAAQLDALADSVRAADATLAP